MDFYDIDLWKMGNSSFVFIIDNIAFLFKIVWKYEAELNGCITQIILWACYRLDETACLCCWYVGNYSHLKFFPNVVSIPVSINSSLRYMIFPDFSTRIAGFPHDKQASFQRFFIAEHSSNRTFASPLNFAIIPLQSFKYVVNVQQTFQHFAWKSKAACSL